MTSEKSVPSVIYNRKFYLTESGWCKELLKGKVPERILTALALAKIKKGMKILEIGTGRGELAIACAKRGAQVEAIDYSRAGIKIAKQNLKKVAKDIAKRVNFKQMNAKKLAFPNKYFDVVFMLLVFEHLYPAELNQALREIKRVLKPGGRAIMVTAPNSWFIKPLYFLAGLLFPWWKKHGMHVNEQSYFSFKRNLKLLQGKVRVWFQPEKKNYSGALFGFSQAPGWLNSLANLLDKFFDNRVISNVVHHTPLALIFGINLWAVIDIPETEYDPREKYQGRYFHFHYLMSVLKKVKGKILDIGCGSGELTHAIKSERPDLIVFACDCDKRKLSLFPKRYGNQGIKLFKSDVNQLSFKNNEFAAVVIIDVLEHLKNPKKALQEAVRVLKKGGIFHLIVPMEGDLATIDGWLSLVKINLKAKPIGHIQQFSLTDIQVMIRESGLVITQMCYSHHFFYQLASLFYYLYVKFFNAGQYQSLKSKKKSVNWSIKNLEKLGGWLTYWESSLLKEVKGQTVHITAKKL